MPKRQRQLSKRQRKLRQSQRRLRNHKEDRGMAKTIVKTAKKTAKSQRRLRNREDNCLCPEDHFLCDEDYCLCPADHFCDRRPSSLRRRPFLCDEDHAGQAWPCPPIPVQVVRFFGDSAMMDNIAELRTRCTRMADKIPMEKRSALAKTEL